jgi:hypothetical protein
MAKEYTIQRFSDNTQSTLGLLFNPLFKFMGFTLEDQHRDVKVKGDTRIAAGRYPLKILKADTPLTIKHRAVYGAWFKYHIEVTGVPNFQGVYLHAGNDELHTEGCILAGDSVINHYIQPKNQLLSSMAAIKRIYAELYPLLEKGEEIYLNIRDESFLL